MPRGRPMHIRIRLSQAAATTLAAWENAPTIRPTQARRGRLIQLLAQDWTVTAAAAEVGLSRNKAYKWIACFQAEGVAGLQDHAAGRPPTHPRRPLGRKPTLTLALTPEDRATLVTWQRSPLLAEGRGRRAELLLLLARGQPVSQAAQRVGIARQHCYKWVYRFQAEGLSGLYDRQRKLVPHAALPRA